MASGSDSGPALSAADRERLEAIRSADSLADLVDLTEASTEHAAYFAAKREWRDLRERELATTPRSDGLPGDCVAVGDQTFCVHGITHAGTDAEREFLREHVSGFLASGATVYCEQGVRAMYFSDLPGVCEMDDYRWAMRRCRELDVDSRVDDLADEDFDGLREELDRLAAGFRDAAFSLIDAGRDLYGEAYARAIGDVASAFLVSHEDTATATDFTSFQLSREAALEPEKLIDLQAHYETAFLPQPIEREWLRRHDRELELFTHARSERMAAYAVFNEQTAPAVHLVVGAAHQPGVRYYLEAFRDGRRSVDAFEPVA